MIAYSVRSDFAAGGGMFRAEVDGPGGVRGIGHGYTERAAITDAWRSYWRRVG